MLSSIQCRSRRRRRGRLFRAKVRDMLEVFTTWYALYQHVQKAKTMSLFAVRRLVLSSVVIEFFPSNTPSKPTRIVSAFFLFHAFFHWLRMDEITSTIFNFYAPQSLQRSSSKWMRACRNWWMLTVHPRSGPRRVDCRGGKRLRPRLALCQAALLGRSASLGVLATALRCCTLHTHP
jgi:hypothetical protein